mmetsp:Transcript_9473/g.17178  ORF Transcript_9473/g.17178 Transcript_9473/m.17178 type:complete len:89 (+) Transcript_9473:1190-1456(+)
MNIRKLRGSPNVNSNNSFIRAHKMLGSVGTSMAKLTGGVALRLLNYQRLTKSKLLVTVAPTQDRIAQRHLIPLIAAPAMTGNKNNHDH